MDLKAGNILLESADDVTKGVVLADFGASRSAAVPVGWAGTPAEAAAAAVFTSTPAAPYSSSPSINSKQVVSPVCDVWSVGVLVVEMLVRDKADIFPTVARLQKVESKDSEVMYTGYDVWKQRLGEFAAGKLWAELCVGDAGEVDLLRGFVAACCLSDSPPAVAELLQHPWMLLP